MDVEQLKAQAKQDGATVQENGLLAAVFAQEVASAVCHPRRLGKHSFSRTRGGLLLALGVLAIGLLAQTAQGGVTFTNLVSFTGTNGDSPIGTLVQGRDGNLYGVTQGGTFGPGPVFKMALNGTLAILASFGGTNGWGPHAGLVRGADGNFYGTTTDGPYHDQRGTPYGTVFRVTPDGLLTTLVSFNGTNGQMPSAELVQGTDGNLYGTTQLGGQYQDSNGTGYGTAFKVTADGVLTTLVSFNSTNGAGFSPWGPLLQGSDGNFYGTTRAGGSRGRGALFQLTPAGALTTVLSFNGTNGNGGFFSLVRGADGNLYGTSDGGGPYWCGTVYRVTAGGVLTTLASFNGTNGATPRGMTQATDGNFYGMTGFGGVGYLSPDSYSGSGTVFQVTPTGAVTSLVLFTNGELPFGGLMQASDGNLYGMTRHGGAYGHGNIFRLSVPMPPILRTMTQTGGTVGLAWSAVAGQKYQVQHSTTLGQTNWFNLGSPFTATDGTATASDTNGPDPQRLYRVVLLP